VALWGKCGVFLVQTCSALLVGVLWMDGPEGVCQLQGCGRTVDIPLTQVSLKTDKGLEGIDRGREGFHMVGEVAGRLVDTIRKLGPETKIDMDLALQAEAFDVIGKVGYAVDFKATADLSGPGAMAADNITHGAHRL
jgi:hypothetical protein